MPESHSSLLGIMNKPIPFICISWCKSNDVYLDRANKTMRPQTRCWRKETIFFCKATLLPATVRRFYREVLVLWCRSDTTEQLCEVLCWLPSLPYVWWLGACSVYPLFWCVVCLSGGRLDCLWLEKNGSVFTCISVAWHLCFLLLNERVELFITSFAVCLYQNFIYYWLDTFKLHYVWILEIYSLWEAMIREGILEYKMHQKNIVVLEAQEKCSIFKPGVI